MKIEKKVFNTVAVKVAITDEGDREIGRAFLYIIKNDLHDEAYGLLEDVFVDPTARGNGVGTRLVQTIIDEAKNRHCYKLIGTSRYERTTVHEWYKKMGFTEHGKEFRISFK